jgi:hypothetical protein
LSSLEVLELWNNGIEPAGVEALAGSAHLATLRQLRLGCNSVGDRGAKALLSSPYLNHLTFLDLVWTGISANVQEDLRQRFGDRVHL